MPLVEGTCQKYALGKHIRWDVATVVEEKGFREVSKSEDFRFSLYIPEQELKGNIMKKGEYYSIKHGIKKKWKSGKSLPFTLNWFIPGQLLLRTICMILLFTIMWGILLHQIMARFINREQVLTCCYQIVLSLSYILDHSKGALKLFAFFLNKRSDFP